MPRRKRAAAAVASSSPRQSPRAAVKASAMPSPASTSRASRSRSTSVSSKGEKTSPAASPAPTSRGARSRSRSAKAPEPVEEKPTPRGRSAKRGAAKDSPSPKASARLTRAVIQDVEEKKSAGKAVKGGRGRSRGRGKKEEEEEEEAPEEEAVEEEMEEQAEAEEEESPKAKSSAKKKPPAKKTPAKKTPAKTPPAKSTPSRAERSRSRQAKEEEEPEKEAEPENESQTTEEGDSQSSRGRRSSRGKTTETKTPPKKATPRNRRGQSKAEASPEKTEEPAEEETTEAEPEAKEETTPKGRSRRAAKSPTAKVTPPPRSRRSRGKGEPEEAPADEVEAAEDKTDVADVAEETSEKVEDSAEVSEPKTEEVESAVVEEKVEAAAEEEKGEDSVAPEEEPQPMADADESAPSGIETPPEESAPLEEAALPADEVPPTDEAPPPAVEAPSPAVEAPPPAVEAPVPVALSEDVPEEEVMEVDMVGVKQSEPVAVPEEPSALPDEPSALPAELPTLSAEPPAVPAAELRQPDPESAMEAEEAAAPVAAEGLEQLSPPSEEAEPAAVEDAALQSAEATVPEAQAPAAAPCVAPYYPEVVTLSPDVPDQNEESVSPPPKSPEIIDLNSEDVEVYEEKAEVCEVPAVVPPVCEIPAVAPPSDAQEVISISPPPEPVQSVPAEPDVIAVSDEINNSVSAAIAISQPSEPITIEDEPVLPSRKRSHEEVDEAADDEDMSSKKAKVVNLTEQDEAFEHPAPQVSLANGNQESPEKAKPVTQQVEPDIVETVVEAMEVGQTSGEGDFNAAPAEIAVETANTVEAVNTVPDSQNTCNSASATEEDILKEYVVIEMGDVPGASTGEVQEAATRAQPSTGSSANHVSQTLPPSEEDPLFNRLFVPNSSLPSDSLVPQKQFAVVSYNILAECWMRRYADAYSYAAPKLFEMSYRQNRIMEELRYLNADVVCLQEVDQTYFESTLLPAMTSLGYGGVFKARHADEGFVEGEAIFYKNSRFTLIQAEGKFLKDLADQEIDSSPLKEDMRACVRRYLNLPDVVLVANLQCKVTGNSLAVGNVHVNYGNFEKPNAQCIQIACAIKELVSRANNGTMPHIICGDFNSPPDSPGYQLARDGYLSDDMIQKLQSSNNLEMPDGSKNALVNHLWKGFQHTSSTLRSAYATVQEVEPAVTSLVGDVIKHCLDYIFYSSGSLDTVGVLQVASVADITANVGLPSEIFPSDHLSMKAVLSFK